MAENKQISELTAASALTGSELLVAEQTGAAVKVTAEQLAGLVKANLDPTVTDIAVVLSGTTLTTTETLEDGSTNTIVVTMDANGVPIGMTVNGAAVGVTMEGF